MCRGARRPGRGSGGTCGGVNPESLSGEISETASLHTLKPVPIVIQGLRSTLNPYTIYTLPDFDEESSPLSPVLRGGGR